MAASTAMSRPTSPNGSPRLPSRVAISRSEPTHRNGGAEADRHRDREHDVEVHRSPCLGDADHPRRDQHHCSEQRCLHEIEQVRDDRCDHRDDRGDHQSGAVLAHRGRCVERGDHAEVAVPAPLTFEFGRGQHQQHVAGPQHRRAELAGKVVVVPPDREHRCVVARPEPDLAQRRCRRAPNARTRPLRTDRHQAGHPFRPGGHPRHSTGPGSRAGRPHRRHCRRSSRRRRRSTPSQGGRVRRFRPARRRRGTRPAGGAGRRHPQCRRRAGLRRRHAWRSCTAARRSLSSEPAPLRLRSRRGAVKTSTAMPIAAIGSPTPVISKTPSGSPPCATRRSDTTRLVDVPITVITPPKTAAYDSGIRYGDADTPERRHQVTTRGAASATNGVFGRIPDSAPLTTASRPSRALLPSTRRCRTFRRPVEHTIDQRRQRTGHRCRARQHVQRGDRDRRRRREPGQGLTLIDDVGEQEQTDRCAHRRRGRQPIERQNSERGDQHHQCDPRIGRHRAPNVNCAHVGACPLMVDGHGDGCTGRGPHEPGTADPVGGAAGAVVEASRR